MTEWMGKITGWATARKNKREIFYFVITIGKFSWISSSKNRAKFLGFDR